MDVARSAALRRGVRLEVVTIAWMLVEAVVALGAGIAARSILLTAFGVDSIVELLSGETDVAHLEDDFVGVDRGRRDRRREGQSDSLLRHQWQDKEGKKTENLHQFMIASGPASNSGAGAFACQRFG